MASNSLNEAQRQRVLEILDELEKILKEARARRLARGVGDLPARIPARPGQLLKGVK